MREKRRFGLSVIFWLISGQIVLSFPDISLKGSKQPGIKAHSGENEQRIAQQNIEGRGGQQRFQQGGQASRPPKQQSRPEGQKEERPAGENKRRRQPYGGGRRWNKGGDSSKT